MPVSRMSKRGVVERLRNGRGCQKYVTINMFLKLTIRSKRNNTKKKERRGMTLQPMVGRDTCELYGQMRRC